MMNKSISEKFQSWIFGETLLESSKSFWDGSTGTVRIQKRRGKMSLFLRIEERREDDALTVVVELDESDANWISSSFQEALVVASSHTNRAIEAR